MVAASPPSRLLMRVSPSTLLSSCSSPVSRVVSECSSLVVSLHLPETSIDPTPVSSSSSFCKSTRVFLNTLTVQSKHLRLIDFSFFSVGWTPLQGLYPAEVLSFENRIKGLSLQAVATQAVSCINTFGLPSALAALTWKVYIIFGAFDFVSRGNQLFSSLSSLVVQCTESDTDRDCIITLYSSESSSSTSSPSRLVVLLWKKSIKYSRSLIPGTTLCSIRKRGGCVPSRIEMEGLERRLKKGSGVSLAARRRFMSGCRVIGYRSIGKVLI